MFFGSFCVFMHVFKCFYKSVINLFFMFFYLQINVFNIYDLMQYLGSYVQQRNAES